MWGCGADGRIGLGDDWEPGVKKTCGKPRQHLCTSLPNPGLDGDGLKKSSQEKAPKSDESKLKYIQITKQETIWSIDHHI